MEKLLWLDGRVTRIDKEEAQVKSHEEITEELDVVCVLLYNCFEFEWNNNIWIQR